MQKAKHSQTISRKKKNVGGLLLPDFNTYYEILITQNNVVLPQKQTCGPMEQNRV